MLPVARHPGRCIYCAFRARQYSLATRRLPLNKRDDRAKRQPDQSFTPVPIRYHKAPESKAAPSSKGAPEDAVVRRFLNGKFIDKSPAARAQDFNNVLDKRLGELKDELRETPLMEQLAKERQSAGERPRSFEQIWKEFEQKVRDPGRGKVPFFGKDENEGKPILQDLREALQKRKQAGLDRRIKYHFYGHVTGARFTKSDIRNQQALADLRYPAEWFPATRGMHRAIHLHVGPTNSGKTYHALQRLEQAGSGVYAGPLRLLAHEVYTRMNAKGKKCSLITGEERRSSPGEEDEQPTAGEMSACTVEMMPLNKTLDVAVIDEIQMIGNAERGWAWTQAVLGTKAREIHMCGEERTVPLITELCASIGEKVQVHKYERLSPLQMAEESLDGKLNNLRKGDCIVSFSVMGIHALRREVEKVTGRKVATVYGSLPPETRAQQARLFNDPNNDYDFLVASDAVGMGLNLAIKRIIFESSAKFDGIQQRTLSIADTKQIAGRAGRYRTAAQANEEAIAKQDLAAAKGEPAPTTASTSPVADNTGIVTTLEKFDFPWVKHAMQTEAEPIRSAGIFPPAPVLDRFASYFPIGTPFSYILTRLHELCQMHTRFHLCGLKDQVWLADLIEPVKGLTVSDRNIICSSPASSSDMELWKDLMPAYARTIAEQTSGHIADFEALPLEALELEVNADRDYLRTLERLHKGIVSYLWLSYRFAGVFSTRALAFHTKELVEEKIEAVLGKFSFSEIQRRKIAAKREKDLIKSIAAGVDEEGEAESDEDGAVLDEQYDEQDEGREEHVEDASSQTTLTSGGDRFAGEEDIPIEDPDIEQMVVEERPSSSFAEWRQQHTRDEPLANPAEDVDDSLMGAALDGEEAGLAASKEGELEEITSERPSAAEVESEAAAEDSSATDEYSSSTGVPGELDSAPLTPETELDRPPLSTQEAAPEPIDARIEDGNATLESMPAGQNQEGGIPVKHLAHLDVNVSEPERDEAGKV